ncbi:putative baseplate assembly protein [Streptomyces sp. GLT-R25]
MALPSPNLDDRRFQQFVDDAKRYIQQRAPEWTDHNVSDPGVTLVETVAHMADQIVYRLNRVPEKNHLAFLDLVGITLFPPSAARTDVTFWLSAPQEEPILLPEGTEVATTRTESEEAAVFATEHELTVVPCELRHLVVQQSGEPVADRTADLAEGKDVMCFLRGPAARRLHAARAQRRRAALRGRDGAGQPGRRRRRGPAAAAAGLGGVDRGRLDRVRGRPGRHRRPEPARRGRPAHPRRAHAVPHRRSGSRLAALPGHRTAARPALLHHLPDRPLRGGVHPRRHHHGRTRRDGVRRGARRVHRSARAAAAPGPRPRGRRHPSGAAAETAEHEGWSDWDVVPSFAASTPHDRHITLDAATGDIAFGPAVREPDGTLRQYGAVAPKGAVIRALRYRTGGGRTGNVARGAVQVLRTSVPYVAEVVNREAARGGVDGETVEEAKTRAPITLRAQERAVTLRDYEELARRAAPETARITCLEGDEGEHGAYAVRVLVVPQAVPDPGGRLRFEQLVPGDALLRRITHYLDERRLIGTRLAVGPPFYQGVTVVATVHAFRGTDTDRVRRQAHDALYRHLDPLTGGADGRGWPFGRPVQSGEVFAVLQRVPGVELVDEVQLHPADPLTGKRGDATNRIDLQPPSLVFSFDHRVRVIGDRP